MSDLSAEIDNCRYLFLSELSEIGHNTLPLCIQEARLSSDAEAVQVGNTVLSGGTHIDVTDKSRIFELQWDSYVAYSVRKQSCAVTDAAEVYEGMRRRSYCTSPFVDYLSRTTFAWDEYPGPAQHYQVAGEDHTVDVVSVAPPLIRLHGSPPAMLIGQQYPPHKRRDPCRHVWSETAESTLGT